MTTKKAPKAKLTEHQKNLKKIKAGKCTKNELLKFEEFVQLATKLERGQAGQLRGLAIKALAKDNFIED